MLFLIWPENISFLYVLKHYLLVFVIVWWNTREQLVNYDSQSPPVKGLVMPAAIQHFWRDVFGCATKSVGEVGLFGQTKICQFKIAMLIENYIFRL